MWWIIRCLRFMNFHLSIWRQQQQKWLMIQNRVYKCQMCVCRTCPATGRISNFLLLEIVGTIIKIERSSTRIWFEGKMDFVFTRNPSRNNRRKWRNYHLLMINESNDFWVFFNAPSVRSRLFCPSLSTYFNAHCMLDIPWITINLCFINDLYALVAWTRG